MKNNPSNITYEQDFYAWLITSAQLLKEQRFSELDTDNIAEELEGMARSDRRQLINRFAVGTTRPFAQMAVSTRETFQKLATYYQRTTQKNYLAT